MWDFLHCLISDEHMQMTNMCKSMCNDIPTSTTTGSNDNIDKT